MAPPKPKKNPEELSAFKRVGRFAALGLSEPWQVALLMPSGYDDFREVAESVAEAAAQEKAVIWLRPVGAPKASFSSGVPRTKTLMADYNGYEVWTTVFGDTAEWVPRITESQGAHYLVQPSIYNGENNFRILEQVGDEWVGRLRPKYQGKPNYLAAEKVRDKVIQTLPKALAQAAGYIEQELSPLVTRDRLLEAAGVPGWTLEQVLEETHLPASQKMADTTREALHRIAAFAALAKAHSHRIDRPQVAPVHITTWPTRMGRLPYTSTPEQRQAVLEAVRDMAQPTAMNRVLVGDVGSGKTTVFATLAVATCDAGGRVAILLPNMPLAEQVHREIEDAWPDIGAVLVTGDTHRSDLGQMALLVGTTALLHREVGEFNLVVVDEEQKFSVEQRQLLAGTRSHMLTSSATCIPRSQALARYGAVGMSILRKSHVDKTIHTRLWGPEEKRELMAELRRFLLLDQQLLMVYPMREAGEDMDPLLSVEHAAGGWERLYPGQVRILTGSDSDERKSEVMADMRENRAKILLATTVVEVGVTLPGLMRQVTVAPERYGLSTLHQIRGRVARRGGEGWCDLYSPLPLKDKQRTKLEAFVDCKDGFEVAELDLKLRGFGDLAAGSTKQSGSDDSFLFGSPITPDHVTPMEELWQQVGSRR
ncbi:MAG: hypothetical protein A2580_13345 [Hydrogenophilales bacterium RIFOXYD1_FULL_62_11]|nr:MAG: hypothetical protein A2580_13345 [Hydrogenophilales bacterium RIFOXYD1_FULL_62_11]